MKKRIFLTGATGLMGWATLQELLKKSDKFDITVLVRNSKTNREKMAPLAGKVNIVWGDLTRYDDVLKAATGADYVLHIGGMVSPKADYFPVTTRKVNIAAAENVARAVLAQPNADDIKVCYIGSVAQTSDHNEPLHWGRCGDPISISVYDHYAISKTIAERIIAESGIKHWVSLRQSGILYAGILKNYDPIMFHIPLRGVLEWTTIEDSARVMTNFCDLDLPEDFYGRFYNIGSGPEYRLTNYEFVCRMLKAVSCPPPEKIFEPQWFVLQNFHGEWYTDSQKLEDYLHFRANIPVDDYFKYLTTQLPTYYKAAKIVPPFILKIAMRYMAYKKQWGTQDWIKTGNEERISAFYGSMENYKAIKPWKEQDLSRPSDTPLILDHGYDESKPREEWDIEDMRKAAAFRGGKCLSTEMKKGDWRTPLEWECHCGCKFKASPALVLLGGHWCPECLPSPWNYDEIARNNPFFAQVWYPNHGKDGNRVYTEDIFKGWE